MFRVSILFYVYIIIEFLVRRWLYCNKDNKLKVILESYVANVAATVIFADDNSKTMLSKRLEKFETYANKVIWEIIICLKSAGLSLADHKIEAGQQQEKKESNSENKIWRTNNLP